MRIVVFIISIFSTLYALGQHEHGHKILDHPDSIKPSLGRDLDKGSFEFHKRSFLMHTINKGELMDYSALATGAGLGYYSPSWKNFHFGFSGFFTFQLFQYNIYEEDPTTSNTNRYEILLFDMNDLENTRDLDRLEELYITYERDHFETVFGRQKFSSPFLNEQDNRMRNNLFNGLTLNYHKNAWDLTAAWFTQVTIRGTVDWYKMDESYGVYPFGRTPFGTPSQYKGNIETLGVGTLGVKHKKENFKSELWNYFNENVFNVTFGQTEYELKRKNITYHAGAQGFYQTAINNGGNSNQQMAYIMKDESTYGVGGKLGVSKKGHGLSVNFLGISNQGRFLFPREWGREQFFASLPRERFEGSGAVTSLMLKYSYKIPKTGWNFYVGMSKVDHAELEAFENNKYGIPSYYHFVGYSEYKFKGYLEGLDIKLFVANKTAQNPKEVPDQFRINRVDLWNFNLVIDYRF